LERFTGWGRKKPDTTGTRAKRAFWGEVREKKRARPSRVQREEVDKTGEHESGGMVRTGCKTMRRGSWKMFLERKKGNAGRGGKKGGQASGTIIASGGTGDSGKG